MDSFEFNKIAGGLLGTLLFVMGLGIFSDALFYRAPAAKPGYDLPAGAEAAPAADSAAAAPAAVPMSVMMAKADPAKGANYAKACAACHSFDKDGAPKSTGPNLAAVLGRMPGSTGFAYSDAMKANANMWTYDTLNTFITNPKAYVPGTKMAYAGEKDAGKRADIIAYLRSLEDNPPPMPK